MAYYRWKKSHIEYAAASTEISGAVRESGNYDPSKSPCGYVWHSDSITVTADKITLNNPTRTNLSANVYGTAVDGYCMCTPLSVTTAPSFDYVYKSSGEMNRLSSVVSMDSHRFKDRLMVTPRPFIKLRHLVQHKVISSNISTPLAPAPTPRTGSAGTTGTRTGRPSPSALRPASASHPTRPRGQQCIRELGSGLFRRRGHLQL